jgi:hypothetical protein
MEAKAGRAAVGEGRTMTEDEFHRCPDPQAMLDFLRGTGRAGERRCRLFACACVRRVWHLLTNGRSRRAVEVAERFADRMATPEELSAAVADGRNGVSDPAGAAFAAWAAAGGVLAFTTVAAAAAWAAREAAEAAAGIPHTPTDADPWALTHPDEFAGREAAWQAERSRQAALLRCLVGNPFRPPSPLPASVLAWNGGCVAKLAAGIYKERKLPQGTLDSGRLAVLADALEEAGLEEQEVLHHLREQGREHYLGCWVLDLVLGKT